MEIQVKVDRNWVAMSRKCRRFSITVFNHRSSVLMESLKATEEHVRFAKKLIQTIEAQGNTNISAGWSSGFHTLVEKAEQKLVIVLSDGLTNAGMVEPSQLAEMTR